jgi:hypothetical protein
VFALVTGASAQNNRSFVASTGDDLNSCNTATEPCRTLSAALGKTNDGGEILAVDAAGFGNAGAGPVTITKSITIDGGAGRLSMASPGTEGVLVTSPNPIVVTLRNITLTGRGTGTNGVRFHSGKRLNLDNVEIQNYAGEGIRVETNTDVLLALSDVQVENVGGIGINVSPVLGSVIVNAKNVRVLESTTSSGIYLNGNVKAVIADSEFSNCLWAGVTIAGTANVALDHVRAVGNKYGVWNMQGSPTTRLNHSTFIGNTTNGALTSAGTMTAYQSNVIENSSGVTSTPPM